MASQEDSPFRGLITSWPALAAMAVTVLSFLAASPKLESPRPTVVGPTHKEELRAPGIPARLWQDPMTTVVPGNPQRDLNRIKDDLPPRECTGSETGDLLVMLVLGDAAFNPEELEQHRRERFAILAALNTAGYVPIQSERLSYVDLDLDSEPPAADEKPVAGKGEKPAADKGEKPVDGKSERPAADKGEKPATDKGEEASQKKADFSKRTRVPFEWLGPLAVASRIEPECPHYRGVLVVWLFREAFDG